MPTSTAYVIGFDFGTNSCRAVLMRADGAAELAVAVFPYPSGDEGVLYDLADAHCARQHPADYLLGVRACVASLIEQAQGSIQGFRGEHIRAIGFGTTGSTVIPVSDAMVPLGDTRDYEQNLAAQAWLWKDHTSDEEARLITARLSADRPDIIARCGGIYSPEWFWAKILHLRRTAPQVFADAGHFLELCEFLPLALSGASSPAIRSACALGHKALYSTEWGGLPDAAVLAGIDPDLAAVAARMSGHALTADQAVGTLTDEWADLLGVSPSVVLAGGAFDAHVGAVGAGIKPGRLIKVMGTSTCDIMISREDVSISGVCGVVRDSVIPGYFGIEAGQSAVGDLFKWFAQRFSGGRNGSSGEERLAELTREAAALRPGQSGLVALDWNNGNRSILVDMDINGLIVGQTLQTDATEIFRALMEATAFGALTIIEQVERSGVAIDDIVCCGGLAHKNPLLMQIYADVTGRPISTAGSSETCAKGAAIFAAAAAGLGTVEELRDVMVSPTSETYTPNPNAHRVYRQLFDVYTTLHDAFGRAGSSGDLFGIMKTLNRIRREASRG